MATAKTTKTTPTERTPEYTVRLTPKGEQYVHERMCFTADDFYSEDGQRRLAATYSGALDASDELRDWRRRERGICSDPDCDEPIAGWCDTCDAGGPFKAPKLCEAHLRAHLATHRGHVPYWQFGTPSSPTATCSASPVPVDPDDGSGGAA